MHSQLNVLFPDKISGIWLENCVQRSIPNGNSHRWLFHDHPKDYKYERMPLISKSTVVCFNRVCPILTWIFVEDKYPSWQYVLPRGRLTIAGLGRSPMEYIAIMEACMNWQKRWLYLVFLGQKNGKLREKTHPPKKYIRKNRTFEKYHLFF